MNRKSIHLKLAVLLACTTFLYACASQNASEKGLNVLASSTDFQESIIGEATVKEAISKLVNYDEDDTYTDWKSENPIYIELDGSTASVNGAGAQVNGSKITITAGGTYVISGKMDNGQIIVDVQDKKTVRLVLNGTEIKSSDNAPIYVKKAGKTIISLEKDTENIIVDGSTYILADASSDELTAAIFSKDDLIINGTGNLTVKANYKDGITSKDDLKIIEGNIQITAVDDGLVGRDLLAVKDGTITIEAGGDAIKTTNNADSTKGIVAIENGTFNLKAEKDGIQAETSAFIADGTFNITSGGGNTNGVKKAEEGMGGPMGMPMGRPEGQMKRTTGETSGQQIGKGMKQQMRGNNANTTSNITPNTTSTTTETETESKKGIKATNEIGIGGGNFNIDSADDSIHSNDKALIEGGNLTIASGDDGIHADATIEIKAGKINITKSYEGIEASTITISDGEIYITASDDGINAAGGVDNSSINGRPGQNKFAATGNGKIVINGGYIVVNGMSDGLDANGSINMTGGTVIVSGSNGGAGNGALDYDTTFEITGGFLVASGGGRATSKSSSQNTIMMSYSQIQKAGTIVSLQDSNGNSIATFAPVKDYQAVVISSPELKAGESYTLYSGGSSTGTATDGLYKDEEYTNGTKVVEFTISESVTYLNESGVTTSNNSMEGGRGGQRGGQRPTGAPGAQGQEPPAMPNNQ